MSSEIRRLYRSRDEAQVAGVCAGLGLHFRIDPVIVRLLAIALTLATGVLPGAIFYVVAWIIVPQEPAPAAAPAREPQTGSA